MLTAVIVPAIIQVILVQRLEPWIILKTSSKSAQFTGGLSTDEIDNPELLLIAILKDIGGKSNIEDSYQN